MLSTRSRMLCVCELLLTSEYPMAGQILGWFSRILRLITGRKVGSHRANPFEFQGSPFKRSAFSYMSDSIR